jgi:predicted secreted hydrolase
MLRRILLVLVAVCIAGVLAWTAWPKGKPSVQASLVAEAAPHPAAGYARATGPVPFNFPADYGPHDDYQTEWWYYTGNLTAASGEHFGYQLTFFRRALLPPAERSQRQSDWAADQVYLGHFALTDVAGNQHQAWERLERGAAGLAGAQASPYRVWLDDWRWPTNRGRYTCGRRPATSPST